MKKILVQTPLSYELVNSLVNSVTPTFSKPAIDAMIYIMTDDTENLGTHGNLTKPMS